MPITFPKEAKPVRSSGNRGLSTCNSVRSIVSDLTHMIGKSDAYQNGSIRRDTVIKMNETGTPTNSTEVEAVDGHSRKRTTKSHRYGRSLVNKKEYQGRGLMLADQKISFFRRCASRDIFTCCT